jgi:3-oxoacyl-[acyl-carrier-protein] synthase-3
VRYTAAALSQPAVIGIRAISYVLPDTSIDLETAEQRGLLDSPAPTLAEFGFNRIRVSNRSAYDLSREAVRRLLDEHQLDPESIDAILFAGALPSSHACGAGEGLDGFNYPVARLQYECGLLHAVAMGVSQCGCTGLMAAAVLAADHLAANPGASRVICVSADVLPPGETRELIYNVISDGACAVLIERGSPCNRIVGHRRITKGYYWNATEGRNELVASYFPTARTIVRDTLADHGLDAASIAAVIPHNVSLRSWQILLPMLGIPIDRLYADNIPRNGHVIAADNFINLKDARADGRIKSHDPLLLFNFGFGANWACMVLTA